MTDDQNQKAIDDEEAGMEIGFSGGELPETNNDAEAASTEGNEDESKPGDAPAEELTTEDEPKPAEDEGPAEKPGVIEEEEEADPDEALMTKMANLVDGRLRNHTGNIKKLIEDRFATVTVKDAKAADAAAAEAGAEAPTNEQVTDALKDGDKFKVLQEEFPEWSEALLESQSAAAAAIETSVLEKLKDQQGQGSQATNEAIEVISNTLVTMAHRNWKTDVQSEKFATWFDKAPDDVKALSKSTNPEDAIKLFDRYYDETKDDTEIKDDKAPPNRNQNRLRRSTPATTSGSGRPAVKQLSEDDGLEIGFKTS